MKLILLDRDGVINFDSEEYIRSEEEWRAIPGSLQAIGRLCRAGWRVVIISNQSGLSLGKFTVEQLNAIHQKMIAHLSQYGGAIDAIFFCPHGPDDGCDCRKPKPGLFLDVSRRLRVPLDGVKYVGDKLNDVKAARAAGASPVIVRTGYGAKTIESGELPQDVPVYDDLSAVVDALLEEA
jgi:D-glycero-D-manno-heptose 1,7-bisphosphate phosphatase